ncbi:hypothetical protein LEMLEM_LOCUS22651 [Lemmus lemmus]
MEMQVLGSVGGDAGLGVSRWRCRSWGQHMEMQVLGSVDGDAGLGVSRWRCRPWGQ